MNKREYNGDTDAVVHVQSCLIFTGQQSGYVQSWTQGAYQVVVRLAVLATLQILALANGRISKRIYALGRHTNFNEALYAFLDRHGIGLEAAR